jgi:hypothetical protein
MDILHSIWDNNIFSNVAAFLLGGCIVFYATKIYNKHFRIAPRVEAKSLTIFLRELKEENQFLWKVPFEIINNSNYTAYNITVYLSIQTTGTKNFRKSSCSITPPNHLKPHESQELLFQFWSEDPPTSTVNKDGEIMFGKNITGKGILPYEKPFADFVFFLEYENEYQKKFYTYCKDSTGISEQTIGKKRPKLTSTVFTKPINKK